MDYKKLILRIKCPEIRECPFQEPMSCTKCRNAVGEDSVFAIKELLSRVEELEAKNNRLEQARENANAACAKWEELYRAELEKKSAWVSVKDRLPELPDFDHCDRMVITCDWKGHVAPMYWERRTIRGKSIERWRYHFDRVYDGFGITHWMPLPEPPKEE